ncbi:MAG: hypothetical protein R3309_06545 [Reinekea sp.]|nr:hypothetical protein [Reinekea sp.]
MERKSDLLKFLLSVATLWGLVYSLYVPGLAGTFLFDDFPNLEPLGYFGGITDSQTALRFVFGNNSGPTGRPVSMASFLLDDNSWPSNPYFFKQTNLLLHLACGFAALLVLNRLVTDRGKKALYTRPHWFCLVVVGIWLLHPINLSTVLYSIQRMAILSAFFAMIALYFYLLFRDCAFDKKPLLKSLFFLLAFFFLSLGIFSKENALLLIPFIIFLEVFYFQQSVLPSIARFIKKHLFLVILILFLIILVSSGWWAQGYDRRDFGVYERLKYQLPIMGDYILKILLPRVSDFNLFSGDYEVISGRDFTIIDYFRSAITFSFLVILVASVRWKYWMSVLGLSWFFIFHILESTFYPLEAYFEHRNYLPAIGLVLFIVAITGDLLKKMSSDSVLRRGVLAAVIVYLCYSLFLLSLTWARPDRLFLKWEMDEPESARAKVTYAHILEQKTFPENSLEHLDDAIKLKPEAIGLHLKKLRLICEFGLENHMDGSKDALFNSNHFDMGVVQAMEELIVLDKDTNGWVCENLGHPISLQRIFSHIEGANVTVWNSTRAARYYALKSDFFARRGNLDASIKAIDKAIAFTPTVDVYLKRAVMLASAGLNDAALATLENAEMADKARPAFYPSREEEIGQLRHRININSGPDL